jgi:putative flippase GtrA
MTQNRLIQLVHHEKFAEFMRYCIVGTIAAAIHYGVYYLLQRFININIAYTVGYCVSLVCNFFLTSYFTFRTGPSAKKVAGFGVSHLVNYLLHISLFNLFIYAGVHRLLAPVFVLMIVVPINFVLLHFVFKSKMFNKGRGEKE